jgi:hypothetical protein
MWTRPPQPRGSRLPALAALIALASIGLAPGGAAAQATTRDRGALTADVVGRMLWSVTALADGTGVFRSRLEVLDSASVRLKVALFNDHDLGARAAYPVTPEARAALVVGTGLLGLRSVRYRRRGRPLRARYS